MREHAVITGTIISVGHSYGKPEIQIRIGKEGLSSRYAYIPTTEEMAQQVAQDLGIYNEVTISLRRRD